MYVFGLYFWEEAKMLPPSASTEINAIVSVVTALLTTLVQPFKRSLHSSRNIAREVYLTYLGL